MDVSGMVMKIANILLFRKQERSGDLIKLIEQNNETN